jgi:hypothetical protein
MFTKGSDAVRPTFSSGLARAAAILFGLATLLDLSIAMLPGPDLDALVAWLGRAALGVCLLVLLASLIPPRARRPRIRKTIAVIALLIGVLAAWVRGHPGVPADPPVLAANVVVSVLLLLAFVRRPVRAVSD